MALTTPIRLLTARYLLAIRTARWAGIVDRGLGLAGKFVAAEILDDAGIGRRKARGAR